MAVYTSRRSTIRRSSTNRCSSISDNNHTQRKSHFRKQKAERHYNRVGIAVNRAFHKVRSILFPRRSSDSNALVRTVPPVSRKCSSFNDSFLLKTCINISPTNTIDKLTFTTKVMSSVVKSKKKRNPTINDVVSTFLKHPDMVKTTDVSTYLSNPDIQKHLKTMPTSKISQIQAAIDTHHGSAVTQLPNIMTANERKNFEEPEANFSKRPQARAGSILKPNYRLTFKEKLSRRKRQFNRVHNNFNSTEGFSQETMGEKSEYHGQPKNKFSTEINELFPNSCLSSPTLCDSGASEETLFNSDEQEYFGFEPEPTPLHFKSNSCTSSNNSKKIVDNPYGTFCDSSENRYHNQSDQKDYLNEKTDITTPRKDCESNDYVPVEGWSHLIKLEHPSPNSGSIISKKRKPSKWECNNEENNETIHKDINSRTRVQDTSVTDKDLVMNTIQNKYMSGLEGIPAKSKNERRNDDLQRFYSSNKELNCLQKYQKDKNGGHYIKLGTSTKRGMGSKEEMDEEKLARKIRCTRPPSVIEAVIKAVSERSIYCNSPSDSFTEHEPKCALSSHTEEAEEKQTGLEDRDQGNSIIFYYNQDTKNIISSNKHSKSLSFDNSSYMDISPHGLKEPPVPTLKQTSSKQSKAITTKVHNSSNSPKKSCLKKSPSKIANILPSSSLSSKLDQNKYDDDDEETEEKQPPLLKRVRFLVDIYSMFDEKGDIKAKYQKLGLNLSPNFSKKEKQPSHVSEKNSFNSNRLGHINQDNCYCYTPEIIRNFRQSIDLSTTCFLDNTAASATNITASTRPSSSNYRPFKNEEKEKEFYEMSNSIKHELSSRNASRESRNDFNNDGSQTVTSRQTKKVKNDNTNGISFQKTTFSPLSNSKQTKLNSVSGFPSINSLDSFLSRQSPLPSTTSFKRSPNRKVHYKRVPSVVSRKGIRYSEIGNFSPYFKNY